MTRANPDDVYIDPGPPPQLGDAEFKDGVVQVLQFSQQLDATDATMSRYQDFGFRGVITKPYEAAELSRTVREVIESAR